MGVALLFLLAAVGSLAGQGGAVEGRVRTADGRAVPVALITLRLAGDTTALHTAETGALGRFRVTLVREGEWVARVERIGFEPTEYEFEAQGTATVNLELVLAESAVSLPGLAVSADRERARFERNAGVTTRELTRDEMKRLPGVAEADVLRAIEVLPGVVTTSDYSSAFNVRGGSADQNLILIDGFPIYNPFHLGGLFSVFNSDMVARAELLAGGFPAEYGGRVASVLSVDSDASGAGTDWDAGVSLLATRVALGADVPDGIANALGMRTARARVSARRSYFDVLLRPFVDFPYHLTDLQTYVEGWTAGGARISLTAYTGRDVLDLAGTDSFPLQIRWTWGNDVIGVRWTHPIGGGASLDARAGYSRFATGIRFPEYGDTDFRSRINQWLARAELDVPLATRLRLRTGIEAGLRWNFGSGLPYTRPLGGYTVFEFHTTNRDGRFAADAPQDSAQLGVILGPRNAERYPPYHRLDISFRKPIQKSWGRMTPYLDILNVYNRKNPLFYFYEFDRSPAVRSGISMFPFLPSFGLEISF